MIYRNYGNTGLQVSRLGFGGMRFENPNDIDAMAEVVLHASSKGVTYFDTAPFYCDDKSEDIFGTAIKEMKKNNNPFYISTKSSNKSELEVRKSIDRSLKRLNIDSIDFFHCWCILSVEQLKNRIKGGALKAMLEAKNEGLIKHIVVSTHMPSEDMKKAFDIFPFEGVTCGYNALNFRLRRDGVEDIKNRGLGVVAMNPLAGGVIPQFEDHFSYLKQFAEQNIIEAALNFIWNESCVDIALVGCRNKSDVDAAVTAADKFFPDSKWKTNVNKQSPDFDEKICTSCQYCDVCPEKIPVFKYLDSYNSFILFDDWQEARNRLKYQWGIHDVSELKKCTECGACESKCTQHIDIIKKLKEILKHFDN